MDCVFCFTSEGKEDLHSDSRDFAVRSDEDEVVDLVENETS